MTDLQEDNLDGLRNVVRLWIYGIALVFIALAIFLLILPDLLRVVLLPDATATICFFIIGLFIFCIYVNTTWLRRKFPVNWIISCLIAACLAFGTVTVLPEGHVVHVLLLSLEVLVMMVLIQVVGSWSLPGCPAMTYLLLAWFVFVVMTSVLMVACCVHLPGKVYAFEAAVHFVLWQIAFPIIGFQAQVISGHWDNLPPILDRPLCSTVLLIDFLACFVFLDCADDIAYEYYYLSKKSTSDFLGRVIKSQM
ncbi:uncharacterized protein LOC108092666 [Drosophila ficusphila]|uniref:uncharacterized protein LOC108092666 n=1 Tax=Drosophila ficusphila TaxID=30025 RepID=UPI0007E89C90|nr:uncharacterized protein LOC108092666 [Drosophila ficusphila]